MSVDQSLGIACPLRILHAIYRNYPKHAGISESKLSMAFAFLEDYGVITDITPKYIIFRVTLSIRTTKGNVGGHYCYSDAWDTFIIERQYLFADPKALALYDDVVTNSRHWGKSAEMALDFLASTLE